MKKTNKTKQCRRSERPPPWRKLKISSRRWSISWSCEISGRTDHEINISTFPHHQTMLLSIPDRFRLKSQSAVAESYRPAAPRSWARRRWRRWRPRWRAGRRWARRAAPAGRPAVRPARSRPPRRRTEPTAPRSAESAPVGAAPRAAAPAAASWPPWPSRWPGHTRRPAARPRQWPPAADRTDPPSATQRSRSSYSVQTRRQTCRPLKVCLQTRGQTCRPLTDLQTRGQTCRPLTDLQTGRQTCRPADRSADYLLWMARSAICQMRQFHTRNVR